MKLLILRIIFPKVFKTRVSWDALHVIYIHAFKESYTALHSTNPHIKSAFLVLSFYKTKLLQITYILTFNFTYAKIYNVSEICPLVSL